MYYCCLCLQEQKQQNSIFRRILFYLTELLASMKHIVFWCTPYSVFVLCVSVHCKLGTIPLSLPLGDFIKKGSVQLRPFHNSSSFHLSTSISVFVLPNLINPPFLTFISCPRVHIHLATPHGHCCGWVVLHYYVRRKEVKQSKKTLKWGLRSYRTLLSLCVPANLHPH